MQSNGSATKAWKRIPTSSTSWCCHLTWNSLLSSNLERLEIETDITLLSETRVKLLGVILDDRLQLNDHISAVL